MVNPLYNPFDRFSFNDSTCFLTGNHSDEKIKVFPEWLIKEYSLAERPIKLLDERIVTYNDILLPVARDAKHRTIELEEEISNAFLSGYETVKNIEDVKLFQWIAKLVYGMIYFEIRAGIRQQKASGELFNMSQGLIKKFSNLHYMLQSVIKPLDFEGAQPWSILIFPISSAPDNFSYRDEINTLTFSLRMKDFGIIACLQDNGANKQYHKDVLSKINTEALHPVQFEELCAKFFYSAYLFNRLPEYTFLPTPDAVYVESMPFYSISGKPLYDEWQNKTYGQVLENFWKPWGLLLFEIIKNPERPMSFLFDENDNLVKANNISITPVHSGLS